MNNLLSRRSIQKPAHRFNSGALLSAIIILLVLFCTVFFLFIRFQPKQKVFIRKFKDSRYQLLVRGKPYIIKGVVYNPVPIGENYSYDLWQDKSEPWKTDGKLMQEMGLNSVRFYQAGENPEAVKKVIGDLYRLYGIRSILGHWLGFWDYPCPRYADEEFRKRIKEEVIKMVKAYKDEEGILLWVLGNENNYSFAEQINPWSSPEIDAIADPYQRKIKRAKIYYSFINEIASEIHKLDPDHPVALGNGELISLDIANELASNIDLVACVIYRGKTFGNFFKSLKATFDRPVVFIEFGCDAFDAYNNKEDQNIQSYFLESQWKEIYKHIYPSGEGNCLGGAIFEWTDEWWKHNPDDPSAWLLHDTGSNWSNGAYYFDIKTPNNKNMNEEWFGIVKLLPEKEAGINKRKPRKSYYALRDFWKASEEQSKNPAWPVGRKSQKSK